jgi:hypothetical protein
VAADRIVAVTTPASITPDTKDWTWILERQCPECGLDARTVGHGELSAAIRENAAAWPEVLGAATASQRPSPEVWSPTEYACHVRDVHTIFAQRVQLVLDDDGVHFANWDQDVTAVEDRYDLQDPGAVAPSLVAAAERVAGVYDGVLDDAWGRQGIRSDGAVFTVENLGRYHLHDVFHHLWDVRT